MIRSALLLAALVGLAAPAAAQQTFVVTTTADPGDGTCDAAGTGDGCTLREALTAANAAAAIDSVHFAIPGSGVHTIALGSRLPDITQRLVIDGYTQPGASPNTLAVGNDADLRIEIDGGDHGPVLYLNCSSGADRCTASGLVVVRGLVVNRAGTGFGDYGVFLNGAGFRIEGNFIGTDPTGSLARRNAIGIIYNHNGGANTRIGGTEPAQRNLISGNLFDGITLNGNPASAGMNGTRIEGNYIGTDAAGTSALGNGRDGIRMGHSTGTRVGGTAPGAGNVIAANGRMGVWMVASNDSPRVLDAVLQGNHIGVGADGTTPLGNTAEGILMNHRGHVIGGLEPGAGNRIGYNGEGVQANAAVTDVLIAGNEIVGHAGSGIIVGPESSGIEVSQNAVSGNGGLGIDLVGCGQPPAPAPPVSPNDPGDADAGPNRCQNHPSIFGTSINGSGDLLVEVFVDTDPANATYPLTVEVFAATDDGSPGEGERFLGTLAYTEADWAAGGSAPGHVTASLGNAVALGVALGDPLVATATDAAGNTSEFGPPHLLGTPDEAGPTGVTVALHAPVPNPSTGRAVLVYETAAAGPVRVAVLDVLGREVAVLVDEPRPAGRHEAVLDGAGLPSGVYLVRLTAADHVATQRLTRLR